MPWSDRGDFFHPLECETELPPLQKDDVGFELNIKTRVCMDSILSLCVACAFFHKSLWFDLKSEHLVNLLTIDSLPVATEDELFLYVLSLGMNADALNAMLERIRWQFVSPVTLLDSCQNELFRCCPIAKSALTWLLAGGAKPEGLIDRKRLKYAEQVRSRTQISNDLIDWLLGTGAGGLASQGTTEQQNPVLQRKTRVQKRSGLRKRSR